MRPPDAEGQAVAVFAALTDPTRRALLEELSRTGPATVTDLARRLPVSRQAVARHLGRLAEAGTARQQVGRPPDRAGTRTGRHRHEGVEQPWTSLNSPPA
ncbi:ArsR/SmtB family transcription factor [Nonomuraea sp. NPDC051191]|uniref:ArsR/SmtB family transcription factor n=1 Tax=Nonomuraea sp. NPDC051191 TaxID=3364372 RepID=UPI0037967946